MWRCGSTSSSEMSLSRRMNGLHRSTAPRTLHILGWITTTFLIISGMIPSPSKALSHASLNLTKMKASFILKPNRGGANLITHVRDALHMRFISSLQHTRIAGDGPSHTQRVTYAPTAREVLQSAHDICLSVLLPQSFVDFADDAIREAVRGAGLPLCTAHVLVPSIEDDDSDSDSDSESLRLLIWRMSTITMWQQLSRTIDEVHEALWAFHHANAGLGIVPRKICDALLFSSLGRHAVRTTTQDELGAFARWAVRIPSKMHR